jgi:hypothetical protein
VSKLKAFLALAGLSVLALACVTKNENTNNNYPSQVTEVRPPSPAPSPSASPAPAGGSVVPGSGPVVRLKITFFTENGNGDKTLKVGDKGTITATPFDANGIDPCRDIQNCSAYGQGDIVWLGGPGVASDCTAGAIVSDTPVAEEKFNRDLKACAPGTYTINAVFKGSIPGALTGTVVKP